MPRMFRSGPPPGRPDPDRLDGGRRRIGRDENSCICFLAKAITMTFVLCGIEDFFFPLYDDDYGWRRLSKYPGYLVPHCHRRLTAA